MNRTVQLGVILCALVALCLPFLAHAQASSIENAKVAVRYEAAGTLRILDKAATRAFAPKAEVGIANGAVRMEADRMVIDAPSGDRLEVALTADSPLVLLRWHWKNGNAETRTVGSLCTFRAQLDLPVPAAQLKALGTKGLTAVDGHPGSYSFLAIADPKTNAGVVAGWVTHLRGSGILFSSVKDNAAALEAQLDYGGLRIAPGETACSEWLAVGHFLDARIGLEQYADTVAKLHEIHLKPQISGYCTWYSQPYGGASDAKHLPELSAFCAKELKPFGLDFIQIDDMWQGRPRDTHALDTGKFNEAYLGKPSDEKRAEWWWGPHSDFTAHNPKGPYPDGLSGVTGQLRADGFVPGLWLMPFAWDPLCPSLVDHQDYFVHKQDGSLYYTMWSGWCLDMTHPEARAFLSSTVRRMVNDWGFRYLKLDGLYSGVAVKALYVNEEYKEDGLGQQVFHDPKMTPIEAYRAGLETVRAAAGPETFVLGCNVSQNMRTLGASYGLVDAMRIGPDNGPGWSDLQAGPWHGSNRYFLHGRVWYNDPDPVYIRPKMPLEHARLLCSWAGVTGQFTAASDWLPGMPPDRIDLLKRILPAHGRRPRPVDYFENDFPRVWTIDDERGGQPFHIIGCFNWNEKEAATIAYPVAKLGLKPGTEYAAFDFWGNTFEPGFKDRFEVQIPAGSCRIFAVRPIADHPFVVSTNRHVTQGLVEMDTEQWDGAEKILQGRSRVVANDPYELRLVVPAGWKVVNANRAKTTGKTGQVRVQYNPEDTGALDWQIRFKRDK